MAYRSENDKFSNKPNYSDLNLQINFYYFLKMGIM